MSPVDWNKKPTQVDIRDIYIERLKEDLMGPYSEEEVLKDFPTYKYSTGIISPDTFYENEDDFNSSEISDNDMRGQEEETVSSIEKNTNLFKSKKPSCAGISFHYSSGRKTSEVSVELEFAVYKNIFKDHERYEEEEKDEAQWLRIPLKYQRNILLEEGYTEQILDIENEEIPQRKPFKLLINCRAITSNSQGKDKFAVTIKFLNTASVSGLAEEEEEDAKKTLDWKSEVARASVFQFKMKINKINEQDSFIPREIYSSSKDEDSEISKLIYRKSSEFATGHICSCSWDTKKAGIVNFVQTEWMPQFEVKPTSASGSEIIRDCIRQETDKETIAASDLVNQTKEETIKQLTSLVTGYDKWIQVQKKKIKDLDASLIIQAKENLLNCEKGKNRLSQGIGILDNDEDCLEAFQLANEAMQLQFEWHAKQEKGADTELKWRPFQLGFALLTLSSVSDKEHLEREIFDLLWFPTGGGKTEAYLLIIAYFLFLRRIKDENSGNTAHVDVFMRYTLRALTEQQFQRATSMILACNLCRERREYLGNKPFSIGLWVGATTTPNDYDVARSALNDPHAPSTPKKINDCPCCGKRLSWSSIFEKKEIIVECTNKACDIKGPLPIHTVDDQIYRNPPSLLIGTVDKFAQVLRKRDTKSLFDPKFPPGLIIQDELHLINGPLGSLMGLLEIGIDLLCEDQGFKPKILGSTATIRQAKKQVKRVYDREAFQFPPPAIDFEDSGFAFTEQEKPGRLYLGVTSQGGSEKTTRERLSASVLQSIHDSRIPDEKKDLYSTLVSFFGSLKILGGALVGMQETALEFLGAIVKERNDPDSRTDQRTPAELTSRADSNQLSEMMSDLEKEFGDPSHLEVCLATNMISVGVDISRLSLMSVNGQPKSMTEYIQATSRVGRRHPGLVITLYNHVKVRDKSYFESFNTWHSSLYRSVEATSVTPFAPRALDKALHQPLMIYYLHRITKDPKLVEGSNNLEKVIEVINKKILPRIERCGSKRDRDIANEVFERYLDWWLRRSEIDTPEEKLKGIWIETDYHNKKSLLISAEKAAAREAVGQYAYNSWPTPNTARNVDPPATFTLLFEGSTNQSPGRARKLLGGGSG